MNHLSQAVTLHIMVMESSPFLLLSWASLGSSPLVSTGVEISRFLDQRCNFHSLAGMERQSPADVTLALEIIIPQ